MAELEVPEGVQAFNFWTILIMARLWEEFPHPQFFSIAPSAVAVGRNYSEVGAPIGPTGAEQVELFRHTLNWLESEGFVSSGAGNQWGSSSVRLTAKGFSVLNEIPRSLASKPESATGKPLGVLMRETVVKEAVSMAGGLIQSMLIRPGSHV